MIPKNVSSFLIVGENQLKLADTLFKCALQFAELGLNIWFISPQPFNRLPENLTLPDKEILQLITFLYLKDYNDLLKHLSGIHLWHKYPLVIIVNAYEHYCKDNSILNAFIISNLLDASAACAQRHQSNQSFLLLSHTSGNDLNALATTLKMYFPRILRCEDEAELLNQIKEKNLL